MERRRAAHARQGVHLAGGEMDRGGVDRARLARALVDERKRGRRVGAFASTSQRARRLVLACDTLALNTRDAQQVRLQVHHVPANVAHFTAAHQTQGIPAFAGVFKLGGQLGIRKHTCRLLVADKSAVR